MDVAPHQVRGGGDAAARYAACLASRQAVACGPNGGLCGQCSDTVAQRLNLEHEIHHAAAKLGILGFEQLK
jgi:hypothetical protein